VVFIDLKKLVEKVPEPIGRLLVAAPYSWRLDLQYTRSRKKMLRYQRMTCAEQQQYVLARVCGIVEYVYQNNVFYRENGFASDQLEHFDDIKRVLIVSKGLLKGYPPEERSVPQNRRMLINTGETSGELLYCYLARNSFAGEWRHMHYIWSRLWYDQYYTKLTFGGKSVGGAPLKHNSVHNEYLVNAYCDPSKVANAISLVLKHRQISFIHRYHALIYDFAKFCEEEASFLVSRSNSSLRGIPLISEYPAPVYRNTIESVFKAPTISWYGHSEAAVLASEVSTKYRYEPLMTYGYAEAVEDEHGRYHLVATSYHNTVSPFIRYDTGDIIVPEWDNQMLSSFQISEGRVGEFIEDKRGRRISLTALIFGRHHKIFESARFVQVRQTEPGKATIIITLPHEIDNGRISMMDEGFDFDDIEIDFSFEVRSEPYTTSSGKVPLLILTQAS
jgi:phenylacetate-CoA ligase